MSDIVIDIEKIKIRDLDILEEARGGTGFGKFLDLLERCAEVKGGGSVRDLPITKLPEIVVAITDAINFSMSGGPLGNSEGG